MATKCFPGWRLGGTSPRFGHPPVPSRGGCPTTRRPQPRPGAPIWPAPSARFFAEPQPAINGGSARSCPACGGGGPRPDSGPPSAARGGEGGLARSRQRLVGYAGRCDRSSPTAASAHRTSPTGVAGPGDRTAEVDGDRRHRDVRRLLAAGPAPSPASPPHARLTGRHPIGCTYTRSGVRPTDIYALARDTPGRRSRDTPSTEPAAFGPATPPVRSNVDTRAHRRAATRRRRLPSGRMPAQDRDVRRALGGVRGGAARAVPAGFPASSVAPRRPRARARRNPQPTTPGPGRAEATSEGGEPVWQRRQGPVTRRSPRGDGCTWSITRIPTSRDAVRPSAVTADSRAAGGSKPPSC